MLKKNSFSDLLKITGTLAGIGLADMVTAYTLMCLLIP
jgi:hypothetical protein